MFPFSAEEPSDAGKQDREDNSRLQADRHWQTLRSCLKGALVCRLVFLNAFVHGKRIIANNLLITCTYIPYTYCLYRLGLLAVPCVGVNISCDLASKCWHPKVHQTENPIQFFHLISVRAWFSSHLTHSNLAFLKVSRALVEEHQTLNLCPFHQIQRNLRNILKVENVFSTMSQTSCWPSFCVQSFQ